MYVSGFHFGCPVCYAETPKIRPMRGIVSSEFYFILTEGMIEQASYQPHIFSLQTNRALANHCLQQMLAQASFKGLLSTRNFVSSRFQGVLAGCKQTA